MLIEFFTKIQNVNFISGGFSSFSLSLSPDPGSKFFSFIYD